MDVTVFKEAQEAYAQGDYATALRGFLACTRDVEGLSSADLSKFYHLIGNCYVKTGNSKAAADYFMKALNGSPETRKPSLYVNLGTALLGTGEYESALEAFRRALDYPIYTTPYKAYSGIGAAQMKLGNTVEAGAAYREAALDAANPTPAKALVNLGICFMGLGRYEDAVSSFETALDFNSDPKLHAKACANLGQAYMGQGRVQKAIDAFESAMVQGRELPSLAKHDYELALTLKDRFEAKVPGILDTGFIPRIGLDAADEDAFQSERAQEDDYLEQEEGFDPFAPKTPQPDAAKFEEEATAEEATAEEAENSVNEEEYAATLAELGISQDDEQEDQQEFEGRQEAADADMADDQFDASAKTVVMSALDSDEDFFGDGVQAGDSYFSDDYYDEAGETSCLLTKGEEALANTFAQAGEAYDPDATDTHMPSPEQTAFFDVTEQEINRGAKQDRKRQRKARGCGLKIAIFIVVICILLAAAACAAYVLGYGYPLQEDVTRDFFAAVQSEQDTSQYWADDVDAATREAQIVSLEGLDSYEVEAVTRSMNQTAVYVDATLVEGGKIDYEVVLSRKDVSWAIEYVQLYFPSAQ